MAEEQVDGGQPDGTTQAASAGASSQGGVQQPSLDVAELQKTFDAFGKQIETLTARVNGLQGEKDKRISGLEGKIVEYESLVERLGSKESALAQMQLQEQLASMNQALQELKGSASTLSPGTAQGGAVNAAQAFVEMGLDLKDPRVAVALNKQYPNEDAAIAAAYKLSKQIQSGPAPSEAQGAALQGKTPAPNDVEALTDEYKKNMLAARGNERELTRIREEAIKQGVPVWSIDFS